MSWNYQRSMDRIRAHLENMGDIEVEKLRREADLEQLLSETTCRDIYGAHVYVQVSNFAHLASDGPYAEDDYKRLIQGVHIYERAVTRIVEGLGGVLVHFQGPKLHALFYRPIDDGEELATRAVLLQLVLKDFVKSIFNLAFPDCDDFTIAGGTDLGNAIGTMDGINGDRELLFVGAPANHAAKIISTAKVAKGHKAIANIIMIYQPFIGSNDFIVEPVTEHATAKALFESCSNSGAVTGELL